MDFFAAQDDTRRRSRLLLIAFVVALLVMGAGIHVSITGLGVLFGLFPSLSEPTLPVVVMIGLVWLTVLLGSVFRWLDVRGGGAVLARRFGAVQASDRARRTEEQVLLNVVAEVAVASNQPAPEVFVLRNESSINAMVLGAAEDKRALVVTQGALEAFDRDELQAVVGHEFGHIASGDLELNMRLVIALGGLNALDEIGRLLIGDTKLDRDVAAARLPGLLLGYALRAAGSLGLLLGGVLRAAVSREREFHADASAAQFTRNPYALASALAVVDAAGDEVALHHRHGGELLHLCFSGGRNPWYRRLIASHPPLSARIHAIDPHFAVKRRKLDKQAAEELRSSGGIAAVAMRLGEVVAGGRQAVPGGGAAELRRVAPTRDKPSADINVTGLSDRILLLLPDERSCLAALFALFAPDDAVARKEYLDAVTFTFDDHFTSAIGELLATIPGELETDRLGIVEHASSVLSQRLQIENRRRVMVKLEALVRAAHTECLMHYATLQLIRRRLDVEFPIVCTRAGGGEAEGLGVKTFDAMGQEIALLLSLIVESSGAPEQVCDANYARVLGCYTGESWPRRRGDEPGVIEALEAAFQTLYVQPRPIRQAFVEHCIEIVQQDGRVERRELAMLELFAASLGCDDFALRAPAVLRAMPRAAVSRPLVRAA